MATLILSAVGTAVGGPVGGAVGALLGRAVDTAVIGSARREGPRLTELAVTTSSYGQPIPRVFGTMRLPGTIIWATDLVESSETSGSKGQPKTTTYSYSISLAVALSSRRIESVGRVWADGALLRGVAGDLKVGGKMRLYSGYGDEPVDPLIAADRGTEACAFRGTAYAVFEDLELASFGNRIPALSFEIHTGDGSIGLADLMPELPMSATGETMLGGLAGFADQGGSRTGLLADVARLFPVATVAEPEGLRFAPVEASEPNPLPAPAIGRQDGENRSIPAERRHSSQDRAPTALRYYDPARDFQPSMQQAPGASGEESEVVEFAGAFAADAARGRIAELRRRVLTARETFHYRIAAPEAAFAPGRCVSIQGDPRSWIVKSWEWHADGVDLLLARVLAAETGETRADAGGSSAPLDETAGAITLRYVELPWDGSGSGNTPQRYAAVSMAGARSPLSLSGVLGDSLVPLGIAARGDCVQGTSLTDLPASPALVFEPDATLDIALTSERDQLQSVDEQTLLGGANRLLLGEEIIQFRSADALGGGNWRLAGLLRGRGGTEHHAAIGQAAGAAAILLDPRLVPVVTDAFEEIAAEAGVGDAGPAYATIVSPGRTLQPLAPVHAQRVDGAALEWRWIRRARGAWRWIDGVDAPLVEEREAYRVGLGEPDSPDRLWTVEEPRFSLPAADLDALRVQYPDADLWVRQIGTHSVSLPTLLPI